MAIYGDPPGKDVYGPAGVPISLGTHASSVPACEGLHCDEGRRSPRKHAGSVRTQGFSKEADYETWFVVGDFIVVSCYEYLAARPAERSPYLDRAIRVSAAIGRRPYNYLRSAE